MQALFYPLHKRTYMVRITPHNMHAARAQDPISVSQGWGWDSIRHDFDCWISVLLHICQLEFTPKTLGSTYSWLIDWWLIRCLDCKYTTIRYATLRFDDVYVQGAVCEKLGRMSVKSWWDACGKKEDPGRFQSFYVRFYLKSLALYDSLQHYDPLSLSISATTPNSKISLLWCAEFTRFPFNITVLCLVYFRHHTKFWPLGSPPTLLFQSTWKTEEGLKM